MTTLPAPLYRRLNRLLPRIGIAERVLELALEAPRRSLSMVRRLLPRRRGK